MTIEAKAPLGGISAQIAKQSYPLKLTNLEIARFEEQHNPLGIYEVLQQLISDTCQARHVRDLVAYGLVGAGMTDKGADQLVNALEPGYNFELRNIARTLVMASFVKEEDLKKAEELDETEEGTSSSSDTTPPPKSETQPSLELPQNSGTG